MDIQATKIELIKRILNTEDKCFLESIKETIDNSSENQTTSTSIEKITTEEGRKPITGRKRKTGTENGGNNN